MLGRKTKKERSFGERSQLIFLLIYNKSQFVWYRSASL